MHQQRFAFSIALIPLVAPAGFLHAAPDVVRAIAPPSAQADAHFGFSVAAIGDFNSDGLADVMVGAPDYDATQYITDSGRAYIFASDDVAKLWDKASPHNQVDGRFGFSVDSLADISGDTIDEALVRGEGEQFVSADMASDGATYLYAGASTYSYWRTTTAFPYNSFAQPAVAVGDVNNDGKEDFATGITSGTGTVTGGVVLISGANRAVIRTLYSVPAKTNNDFGYAIAAVPDLDDDGVDDILVGAPQEDVSPNSDAGAVYLFSGASGTLITRKVSPTPAYAGAFGAAVCGIPDITGDGKGEYLVAASSENDYKGRVHVFSGANHAEIKSYNFGAGTMNYDSGTRANYIQARIALAAVDDYNGDRMADFAVAKSNADSGATLGAGRVYIYSGKDFSLLETLSSPNAKTDGLFGHAITGLPDIDGDGQGEIIVGAPKENLSGKPTASGAAYIFSGPAAQRGPAFGDFDDSGCTGLDDFLFVLDNWQTDVGGFGTVGLDEFLLVLDHWQTGILCD